jgi:hypothetical protein
MFYEKTATLLNNLIINENSVRPSGVPSTHHLLLDRRLWCPRAP